jgi:nitric oxide synthase oxygenase domain/subunit
MDAEIGVRNLADSFRYNCLPSIARAIGLTDKNVDDLPDYERLAVLVSISSIYCARVHHLLSFSHAPNWN